MFPQAKNYASLRTKLSTFSNSKSNMGCIKSVIRFTVNKTKQLIRVAQAIIISMLKFFKVGDKSLIIHKSAYYFRCSFKNEVYLLCK